MKVKILICLAVFSLPVFKVDAQQKEWQNLLGLLQKEVAYFQGTNGFITLTKSEYNTFSVEKFFINDSLFVLGMRLRDRFGNESTEHYVEETIVLEPGPVIISAEIYYGFSFYFKDFPDAQFLRLEFDEKIPMIDHFTNIYKDLETGQEDRNEIENKTNRILLPIRAKNRAEILSAIDDYQRSSLKPLRDQDRMHSCFADWF